MVEPATTSTVPSAEPTADSVRVGEVDGAVGVYGDAVGVDRCENRRQRATGVDLVDARRGGTGCDVGVAADSFDVLCDERNCQWVGADRDQRAIRTVAGERGLDSRRPIEPANQALDRAAAQDVGVAGVNDMDDLTDLRAGADSDAAGKQVDGACWGRLRAR